MSDLSVNYGWLGASARARENEIAELQEQLAAANARAEAAEAKHGAMLNTMAGLIHVSEEAEQRAERAEAVAGRLRAVLSDCDVQWGDRYVNEDNCDCSRCPKCGARPHLHAGDCPVRLALADNAGTEVLAEWKRLRRLLGHIVDILGNEEDDAAARRAITHYVQAALDAPKEASGG